MTSTDKWISNEHTPRRREASSPALVFAWIFIVVIVVLSLMRFFLF
jgi:hypothetical protein